MEQSTLNPNKTGLTYFHPKIPPYTAPREPIPVYSSAVSGSTSQKEYMLFKGKDITESILFSLATRVQHRETHNTELYDNIRTRIAGKQRVLQKTAWPVSIYTPIKVS